jgi:hypothetical protein
VVDEQVGQFALHVPLAPAASAAVADSSSSSSSADADVDAAFLTGDSLGEIWEAFAAAGGSTSAVVATHTHGAATATATVPAMSNQTLTVVFAWHFPTRFMTDQHIGNYYATHLYSDAASAAEDMADDLASTVDTIKVWCGAVRCVVWRGAVWCGVSGAVWRGAVRYGVCVVRCGAVQLWCGSLWCGALWWSAVQYCNMVWLVGVNE